MEIKFFVLKVMISNLNHFYFQLFPVRSIVWLYSVVLSLYSVLLSVYNVLLSVYKDVLSSNSGISSIVGE